MANGETQIGEIVRIKVLSIVHGNSNDYYLVKCLGRLCRIPMFDWQKNKCKPNSIRCRIVSINEFGFPKIEQVAEESELNVVEPVTQKVKAEAQEKIQSFQQTFDTPKKEEKVAQQKPAETTPVIDNNPTSYSEQDFLYYRWANQNDNFDEWFISTGGLKARLQILVDLARQLANYHRQNKVYKELVPEFIKIVKDRSNILKVKLPETNYYTSGFGDIFIYASHAAPEVVNRRMPNTPMSDCYTFAILAFELLEFCHPFLGDDAIKNNHYEDAFKGRLAWIDNPEDDSNRHVTRYFDRMFTTMSLWKLFVKTFTIGMYDVFSRPSIFEWLSALEDEQKKLRYCSNCKTDFLCDDIEDECPFCDENLDFDMVVDIAHLTPKFIIDDCRFAEEALQIEDKLIYSTYLNKSNPLVLKSSDLMHDSDKELELLSVHVTSNDDNNIRVVVDPKNGASFFIATPGLLKYNQKIDKATSIPFSKQSHRSLVLSLQDINEPQRVIILTATN